MVKRNLYQLSKKKCKTGCGVKLQVLDLSDTGICTISNCFKGEKTVNVYSFTECVFIVVWCTFYFSSFKL